MILKTIQNKEVLNILKNGETYFADYNKIKYSSYKKQWKKLAELCKFSHCPIYCVPENNDYAIGASNIYEDEDNVLLELNVPKKECKIMDYYDWSDYLLYSSGGDYDDYFHWAKTKALNNIDKYIILGKYAGTPQIVIEKIEPKWLILKKEG